MNRLLAVVLVVAASAAAVAAADGRIKQYGKAIVEYRAEDVKAVASYEFAQRAHDTPWLLIEVAVQAKERIVIHRNELSLIGPDERSYPIATQQEFLDDQQTLTRLLQNASVWRRPLEGYFPARPIAHTIRFVSVPGGTVTDTAVTNQDEVATGDLFFKSADGRWSAGAYRLVLNHQKARAELPIVLR